MYDDVVIKLLDEDERNDESVREHLSDRQRVWWDAGRRPQTWNAWQGYTQWTLGNAVITPMTITDLRHEGGDEGEREPDAGPA